MKAGIAGIVLAGGRSSRFGADKAEAAWEGATLLEQVVASIRGEVSPVIVVTKHPESFRFLRGTGVRISRDKARRSHPLVGLQTGLALSPTRFSFVCACDMPLIKAALVKSLRRHAGRCDAVIPLWKGRPQPLCGLYSKRCLPALNRLIRREGRAASMRDLLSLVRTRYVAGGEVRRVDPEGLSFLDIDTREDYRQARRRHGG